MIPLEQLRPGQQGMVHALRGGRHFVARLAALGFTPGALVTIVRNHGFGPLIVEVRGTQIAMGRGEARHVLVYQRMGELADVLIIP
ncbi:MAG: FeoA family protein [Anaerolineae bacterium]|jgi:ferrous iron transport protein A|nr:FeoA family protein [Anaerolineae bacterium]